MQSHMLLRQQFVGALQVPVRGKINRLRPALGLPLRGRQPLLLPLRTVVGALPLLAGDVGRLREGLGEARVSPKFVSSLGQFHLRFQPLLLLRRPPPQLLVVVVVDEPPRAGRPRRRREEGGAHPLVVIVVVVVVVAVGLG